MLAQLEALLAGRPVDVVVSDMAPNLSGIESDAARIAHLVRNWRWSSPPPEARGRAGVKCFHGSGYSQLVEALQGRFRVVKPIKPKASRDKSAETFLVGIGLKNLICRDSTHADGRGCRTSPGGKPYSGR